MYSKITFILLFYGLLYSCAKEPLSLDFDVSIPEFTEPDYKYCDYNSYVELEGEAFGDIKSSYRITSGETLVFDFDDSFDELIIGLKGFPGGFKAIKQDTIINIKDNDNVSLYFKFNGSSGKWARDGNLYCTVLSNNRIKVTWCNLRVEDTVGSTLQSKGSFVY